MFNEIKKKQFQKLFLWSVFFNFFLIAIIIVLLTCNNLIKHSFKKRFFVLKSSLTEDKELLVHSLAHLHEKSLQELSDGLIENYGVIYGRDFRFFILGELVLKFDIDLARALERPVEFIRIKIGTQMVPIPSQCSELEFKKISKFLKKEKYPFTPKGLLNVLSVQLQNNDIDEDLLSYFMHSEAFQFFSSVLKIKQYQINPAPVLRMVIEGGAPLFFDMVCKHNMQSCDPDVLRREILFNYLNKGFSLAAELFILLDMEFLIHESRDQDLKNILKVIHTPSPIYEKFLATIIESSREDSIRLMAENVLSQYMRQFFKENLKIEKPLFSDFKNRIAHIPVRPFIEHVVVAGESLGEISKKYKVSITRIMQINQLSSGNLLVGQKLKIPQD